jgi:HAD superfamily hydrolase (TIGR01509 family)
MRFELMTKFVRQPHASFVCKLTPDRLDGMKPRAVLFDIGSTLWSSPAEDPGALAYCYGRARAVLLEALPDVPPTDELIHAVEGYFGEWEDTWKQAASHLTQRPTTEFVAEALARIGLKAPPAALAAFTDELLETSVFTAKALPPEPGMSEALAGLKQLGVRLGCVSNAFMSAATLHRIMEARGLGAYLELTVSSCETGYRKPHPAIYQAALDGFRVTGDETIFVGDRIDADVEGPAALGMRTVLTLQYRREDHAAGKVSPDCVIEHLSELVPYVASLLKD